MGRRVVLTVAAIAVALTAAFSDGGSLPVRQWAMPNVVQAADDDAEKKEPKKHPVPDSIHKELKGHWAAEDIVKLIEKGILAGFPDGSFRPENNTTRFELAKMLAAIKHLEPVDIRGAYDPLRGMPDADVMPAWVRSYVAAVVRDGLMAGTSEGFTGDELVTREQVAAVVARLFKHASYRPLDKYADWETIAPWAQDGFKKALALGIFEGYPDNTLRPRRPVTRAELAKILVIVDDQL